MMASIFTRDKKNIGSKKTNNVYKKQSLPRTLASLNLPTANGFDILREPRNGVNLSVQTQKYEDKVFNYTKNSPIAYRNNNLSFFSGYSLAKVNALNLAREKDLNQQTQDMFPMNSQDALKNYDDQLTEYEKSEIHAYKNIYFIGKNEIKKIDCKDSQNNFGFDDERGDYRIVLNDHFAYRFEVFELLGKGSFGQVVKAFDHKHKMFVAVKTIRNKKRFHQQALVEVKILQTLREK
ncbi:hypothetical protein ROZALSC1DRAFT_23915, partial [Rozella allomycis CSF55]